MRTGADNVNSQDRQEPWLLRFTRIGRRTPIALAFAAASLAAAGALLSCADDLSVELSPLASVRVHPDSSDVQIGQSVHFQAIPLDVSAAFLSGKTVAWSSDDTGVATVSALGVVEGVGEGNATITAEVDGMPGISRVRVRPPPAIGLSRTEIAFEKSADEEDPPPETVDIENTGGFDLENLDVAEIAYGSGAEDWLGVAIAESTAPTTLTVSLAEDAVTEAGTYTATLPVTASDARNSPAEIEVTLVVRSGAAALIEASGDGQYAVVETEVETPPSVRVTDAFGNPVAGIAVTFEVTGGGGSVTGAEQTTDGDGSAAVGSWTVGAGVGENALQAVADGLEEGLVTFTATAIDVEPGEASPLTSTVASVPESITANDDGSSTSTFTVTVLDPFGDPVADRTVTPAATGTNNVLSPSSADSDADGVATFTFRSTTAQTKTLSAEIFGTGTIQQTASVTVNAAAPASVTVANQGFTAGVGTSLALAQRPTFTVRDAFSNLVPNHPVSYGSVGVDSFTGAGSTSASGTVTLSSWTVGGSAADSSDGRMQNSVTLTAGSVFATATNWGIYRWEDDVEPLVGSESTCTGCHAFTHPDTLVNASGTIPPCASTSHVRVVAGDADASLIYRKLLTSPPPPCGLEMDTEDYAGASFSDTQLKIVRAWINNGAFNN